MKKSLLLLAFFSMGLVAYGGTVKVTFSVDMSIYQKNAYFSPATDTVWVAGDFNSWSTTANRLTRGTGADTGTYSVQASAVPSGAINYKFLFNHAGVTTWDGDPNRTAVIGANDTTLPKALFNRITGNKYHVWFKVDMTLPLKTGAIVPPPGDTIAVTGDFTNWGSGAALKTPPDTGTGYIILTKDTKDSVYAGICDSLTSGRTINFKYIYFANGQLTWESPTLNTVGGNRTILSPNKILQYFRPIGMIKILTSSLAQEILILRASSCPSRRRNCSPRSSKLGKDGVVSPSLVADFRTARWRKCHYAGTPSRASR